MKQPTQEEFEKWRDKHRQEHPADTIAENAWNYLCELWFRKDKDCYQYFCCCARRVNKATDLSCSDKNQTYTQCWKEEFENDYPRRDWKRGKQNLKEVYSAVEDFVRRGNEFPPEKKTSRVSLVVADIVAEVVP